VIIWPECESGEDSIGESNKNARAGLIETEGPRRGAWHWGLGKRSFLSQNARGLFFLRLLEKFRERMKSLLGFHKWHPGLDGLSLLKLDTPV
jgi:hypothetical protein